MSIIPSLLHYIVIILMIVLVKISVIFSNDEVNGVQTIFFIK